MRYRYYFYHAVWQAFGGVAAIGQRISVWAYVRWRDVVLEENGHGKKQ